MHPFGHPFGQQPPMRPPMQMPFQMPPMMPPMQGFPHQQHHFQGLPVPNLMQVSPLILALLAVCSFFLRLNVH